MHGMMWLAWTALVAVGLSSSSASAPRASPVTSLLNKLKQDGRGVQVGAGSGAPPPTPLQHDMHLSQPAVPPLPPVSPVPPEPQEFSTDSAARRTDVPQAAGLDQESVEAEALEEALRAPLIGRNGEDRSVPQPREASGAGRKDDLRSDRDSWGEWFSSLLPGSSQAVDSAPSSTPAREVAASSDVPSKISPGSGSAPTGGIADGAPVDGHKIPPPDVLKEQLWRKPDDARGGRGRGRGRVSPVSELLKTMQGSRGTSRDNSVPESSRNEQRGQSAQPTERTEQSDSQGRVSSSESQPHVADKRQGPLVVEGDDDLVVPPSSRTARGNSGILAVNTTLSDATDAKQNSRSVADEARLPVGNTSDIADPKLIAMEKLKAFQRAAKAKATSPSSPGLLADKMQEPSTRLSAVLSHESQPAVSPPAPSPVPEIIDEDEDEDEEDQESDSMLATEVAFGYPSEVPGESAPVGPSPSTLADQREAVGRHDLALDAVSHSEEDKAHETANIKGLRSEEPLPDHTHVRDSLDMQAAGGGESGAGTSKDINITAENVVVPAFSTPAVQPSIDGNELHGNLSEMGHTRDGQDVEPTDGGAEILAHAETVNDDSQAIITEEQQMNAESLTPTPEPPPMPSPLGDEVESVSTLEPVPLPLDPVESATIGLWTWLRSHGAETHTDIIAASFVDAGYDPHEWVDTMKAFSVGELSAFLEAVGSTDMPEQPAVVGARENTAVDVAVSSTQGSDRGDRALRHNSAKINSDHEDGVESPELKKYEAEICSSHPCQNDGRCSEDLGVFWCNCRDGFRGETCTVDADECASRPCRNGATCHESGTADVVNVGHYICFCTDGWRGSQCDEDIDECLSLPCLNEGICTTYENDAYACECQPGFEGANCGIETEECASSPCLNGGACVEIDPPAAPFYNCNCSMGFAGSDCGIDIDECESAPCQNGGACMNSVAAYVCDCFDGFSGFNCDADIPCASKPCQNGGSCTTVDDSSSRQTYSCVCSVGFDGSHCEVDVDECASGPCKNAGTCVDGPASFTCNCTAGFGGTVCSEDADECASNPCTNGGTCTQTPIYTTATGSVPVAPYYLCECPEGFQGENCDIDIDECESSPCKNGAECRQGVFQRGATVARFSCICPDGLAGILCERDINECISSPCLNGATCTESSSDSSVDTGSFLCICSSGFGGFICEEDIDECASQPCKHGGACVEAAAPKFFRCLCRDGFAGDVCDAEVVIAGECDSQPCQNGGICEDSYSAPGVVSHGSFLCDCQQTGFAGVLCDAADPGITQPVALQNHSDNAAGTAWHTAAPDNDPPGQSLLLNMSVSQVETSTDQTIDTVDAQSIARESAIQQLLATQSAHGAAVGRSDLDSPTSNVNENETALSPVTRDEVPGKQDSEPAGSTVGRDKRLPKAAKIAGTPHESVSLSSGAALEMPRTGVNETVTQPKTVLSDDRLDPNLAAMDEPIESEFKLVGPGKDSSDRAERTQSVAETPRVRPASIAAARRMKTRKVTPLQPELVPGNEVFGGSAMVFLDVRQIGDIKLVKLQNPVCGFDPACGEWQGDWSDNSTLWENHPRVKTMLKPQIQPDGVFWMPFNEYKKRFHGADSQRATAAPYFGSRPIQRNGRSTDPGDAAPRLQKDISLKEARPPSAAEFLASVREHFDGGVGYAYFLRVLKLYSTGNQTSAEVHIVVQQLFQDAPHLMRGFNALVPPPKLSEEDHHMKITQHEEKDDHTHAAEDDQVEVASVKEIDDDGQPDQADLTETVQDNLVTNNVPNQNQDRDMANREQMKLDLDPCASTPCVAGSTCTPDPDIELGFKCTCASGYTGIHCQMAECPAGYWESSTGGRACAPLSVCNFTYQYEARAPNKTRDRVCLDIRQPCEPGSEFEFARPTNSSDRVCQAATICQPGIEYEAAPVSKLQDRVCKTASPPCVDGAEWEASPPTAHHDRECRTVTKCAGHQLERSPPGPSSDRVCFGLVEAAADGSFSLVAQLLALGGNSVEVNAKNEYGHTALHEIAAATSADISSHDRLAVVDKLLDGGADVAAQNLKGHTPLHIAADVGNADAASALLARRGVDVNAIDGGGNTPLHFAAEMGHSAVAEVLLERGATVNTMNSNGRTPAHLTDAIRWHEYKHSEIVRVLKRYGGELRRYS